MPKTVALIETFAAIGVPILVACITLFGVIYNTRVVHGVRKVAKDEHEETRSTVERENENTRQQVADGAEAFRGLARQVQKVDDTLQGHLEAHALSRIMRGEPPTDDTSS